MSNVNNTTIFLVDDDAMFLKLLEIEFNQNTDFTVKTYATGEDCINELHLNPDLIVLDYHLDGINKNAINGIETLDKIKAFNKDMSVVMLSSQDKIETAIDCMHHKAFDYVVKSETAFIRLSNIISTITHNKKIESALKWYMERM